MGLGRDMRLSAASMAAEYARGIADEGARRDRRRDGRDRAAVLDGRGARARRRAHVHRLAQPARPTPGAKLVKRGALALSGDSGIREVREIVTAGEPGPPAERPGRSRPRTWATPSARTRSGSSTRSRITPRKVVLDGSNGMAGPMVGTAARRLPDRAGAHLLGAGRRVPGPRAQPAARGEPPLHHRQAGRDRRRARHRLGRRRRPLLLHRRHRPLRGRRLPHRAARRLDPAQGAGRRDPVRRARLARRPRHGRGRRRHGPHQPGGPRILQDAHARAGRGVRRRGVGPLLLPRLLLRRLRDDPGAPDPGAPLGRGQDASASCWSRCARATSSRARSTPRWRTRTGR